MRKIRAVCSSSLQLRTEEVTIEAAIDWEEFIAQSREGNARRKSGVLGNRWLTPQPNRSLSFMFTARVGGYG